VQMYCQMGIVLMLVLGLFHGLFHGLWLDTNGREAKPPGGFSGAVCTILSIAGMVALYYGAGAFSELIQK